MDASLGPLGIVRSAHNLWKGAANLRKSFSYAVFSLAARPHAKEKNDEARPDRYFKHGHFPSEPWPRERERADVRPLRRLARLQLARLRRPTPQHGAPRRCAQCSAL